MLKRTILLAIILVLIGLASFLYKAFTDPRSTITTAESALLAITAVNEGQKLAVGEYYSSKESLKALPDQPWEVYWTADDLPKDLKEHLSSEHLPFLSRSSYRALMKVNFNGRTFLIERNAGQVPQLIGEVQTTK